jgi:alpha-tubulin N-acetyltransferase 1
MLQFMQKHYSLKKLVDQGNNFVIFEEFFDTPGNPQNKTKIKI